MKLYLVVYKCAHCNCNFEAPSLGESAYGEFLLRSKSGILAYLNAFIDPTYKEFDRILAIIPKISDLQPLERAKLLRRLYGPLACDLDENNCPFELGAPPICSVCGSQDIVSWNFKINAEMVEVPVSTVTHVHWSNLSHEKKIDLIENYLSEIEY